MTKQEVYRLLKKFENLSPEEIDQQEEDFAKIAFDPRLANSEDGYPHQDPYWRAACFKILEERESDIQQAEDFLKRM